MGLMRMSGLPILALLIVLTSIDLGRHVFLLGPSGNWPDLAVDIVVLIVAFVMGTVHLDERASLQARLARQNRELLALHQAGLDIGGDLGLESVLQTIVDRARELGGARYGAISLLANDDRAGVFLTSGISADERVRIGAYPCGRGLLGVVLTAGQRLRLADLTRHPLAAGFPPHHPVMRSLLAVPIVAHGRVLGNLYLTEKDTAPEFSEDDEDTLVRFATQAALAIANARLHSQVRELAITEERVRIARELHDSIAQVLGYANTQAQAVETLLQAGRPERAAVQMRQLAVAARAAYVDVREGILGLRTTFGAGADLVDTLCEYLEHWQGLSGIPAQMEVAPADSPVPQLPPATHLQLMRIVQEALANVRKHARATRADVRLSHPAGWIDVVVEDDGAGFDPAMHRQGALPSFGLATMRERTEAIGGTLAIDSAPGRGTRVTVHVPTRVGAVVGSREHDAPAARR